MSTPPKHTDDEIRDAYERTGSIWKAADELGMCGQSVHERLVKMGVDTSLNLFTEDDEKYLAERYVLYRDAAQLQVLADELGRTKAFICRKARALGLTDRNWKMRPFRKWTDMPDAVLIGTWERFKRGRAGVSAFCRDNHYNIQSFTDAMRRVFPDEYDAVVASKKPKRTQYARGRDFEYAVRDDMSAHGYIALRSPASKSPADLYCVKSGELVFIQCKLHGALYRDEWNEFLSFCESVDATPIMARRGDNGRGIEYFELTGYKDKSRRASPMVGWRPSDKEVPNGE